MLRYSERRGGESARARTFAHEFLETLIIYRDIGQKLRERMKRRVRNCERDMTTRELFPLTSYRHVREYMRTS